MNESFIFGYGSLVNRHTHDYQSAHRARLHGWRRVWHHTTSRAVAFLNVMPEPGHTIRGTVIGVPLDAPELDQRERAYSRRDVTTHVEHPLTDRTQINLFAIPPQETPRRDDHVLLLSYIDVVAQGYLREFGSDGVAEFFETTEGWDAPVIDDRAAPRYPRAQPHSAGERALVDHWLARIGASVRKE